MNARNKALLKSNDYSENSSNDNYAFGNSFQVVYDKVRTFNLYGELKADFSENVIFFYESMEALAVLQLILKRKHRTYLLYYSERFQI